MGKLGDIFPQGSKEKLADGLMQRGNLGKPFFRIAWRVSAFGSSFYGIIFRGDLRKQKGFILPSRVYEKALAINRSHQSKNKF